MRVFSSSIFVLALSSASLIGLMAGARAQVSAAIEVTVAPPPLPLYDQPPLPEIGYLWVPGYWAWDGSDYYWVPGSWVLPPQPGLFWTPGYWGWNNGFYTFFPGYWGASVGYYGDVDYGYGYYGLGYQGGYWDHGNFYYNRRVNNVANVRDGHFYDRDVANPGASRVSYHGGPGGTQRGPNRWEIAARRGLREDPTAAQTQHQQAAAKDPALRFAKNHGEPPVAATDRPGALGGPGVVAARRADQAPKPGPGGEPPKAHEEAHGAAVRDEGASRAAHAQRAPRPAAPVHLAQGHYFHHAPPMTNRAAHVTYRPGPRMHQPAPAMYRAAPQAQRSFAHFGGGGGARFGGGGGHFGGFPHIGGGHLAGGGGHLGGGGGHFGGGGGHFGGGGGHHGGGGHGGGRRMR